MFSSIDFSTGEDDQLIGDALGAFAAEQLRPNIRVHETARGLGAAVRGAFSDLGFDRMELSEDLGGAGLGLRSRVLANAILAKADAGAALALDRLGPALYALAAFGGEAALARFAKPLLDDPAARAVLVIEDADRDGVTSGGRVSGAIAWAPTDRADLIVGLGPSSCWVLAGGSATSTRGFGLHAAGASRIDFEGPALAAWTGDARAGAQALAKTRLTVAALIVGVTEDSVAFSRDYAQGRVAFGQPIAHHQGLAFLMVDMHTTAHQARLLVEDAARQMDAGRDGVQAAAAAFVEAVEASRMIGPNGVQILGGHGFMRDFPMEKAMRDVRALGLLAGGYHRARDEAGSHPDALSGVYADLLETL